MNFSSVLRYFDSVESRGLKFFKEATAMSR